MPKVIAEPQKTPPAFSKPHGIASMMAPIMEFQMAVVVSKVDCRGSVGMGVRGECTNMIGDTGARNALEISINGDRASIISLCLSLSSVVIFFGLNSYLTLFAGFGDGFDAIKLKLIKQISSNTVALYKTKIK